MWILWVTLSFKPPMMLEYYFDTEAQCVANQATFNRSPLTIDAVCVPVHE